MKIHERILFYNSRFIFSLFAFIFILFINEVIPQEIDSSEYKTPTIEVDAMRELEKMAPITFENIKRETIENKYWMQDLPMFLSGNTSINSYSESGASIGYSFFTIRGFDQRRISVLLNNAPQNDPEDHQVYWVELSDIMSSVEGIQLQRGIGTILYGTSGVGGIINVQTIDYFKNKFINIFAGHGNFNSSRYSIECSSGMTESGFGFYGKFSKTKTDGYRNLSWSDHYSYFLSAGKMLNDKSSIKLNVYGSPNKNHLAYLGVTKKYLEGRVTGYRRIDRRYNPLNNPNESDNNNKPHFELVFNWQPNKNFIIWNTFNYIRGERTLTANYPISKGMDFTYFHLQPFYVTDTLTYNPSYYLRNKLTNTIDSVAGLGYKIVRSDMVVNISTSSNDYGWYPKIQLKHFDEKANLIAGGELRFHKSEHYGEITFGNALPKGTPSDYKYYFYNGKKTTASIYVNEFTNVEKKLTIMAGVQFTYHKYSIENDAFKNYNFGAEYKFLTSRVGFNYNFNDNIKVYSSVCLARREPRLKDFYDADSPNSRPNLKVVDTINKVYSDPLVQYEELTDYEFGAGYKNEFFKSNLNFYYMDYKNEIVNSGMLNNIGEPVYGNAGRTIHRGIEAEVECSLFSKLLRKFFKNNTFLNISGNLNLSDNYFVEYIETLGVDTLGNIIKGKDYSGNQIMLTPQIIGNLSLGLYSEFGLSVYISLQYIGKQYLDNSENERKDSTVRKVKGYIDKDIKPYAVFNTGISLDFVPLIKSHTVNKYFKSLEISLKVNNIFDRIYETYGGVDQKGVPNWIPAADRNYFLNLKAGF